MSPENLSHKTKGGDYPSYVNAFLDRRILVSNLEEGKENEMKKLTLLFGLIFVLASFGSASAIDRTGTFSVGGHVGYSFGFGNVFDEYEVSGEDWLLGEWDAKYQNKVTYSFWGNIKYGVTPNFAVMAAVDYQAGDVDVSATLGGFSGGVSESYHWTSVLGNGIFTLSPERNTCPYLTFGGGIYFNDDVSEPGANFGGGIEHFFQDNLALDVGTRYHMIFTEGESTNYLNIYGGLNYYFGVK
jgi:hypothetical protein